MKKLMAMLLLAGSIQGVYAQKTEKKEMFLENKSLYEELTNVQKKTDKFNLYLNMQGSFDANFRDGFDEGVFKKHLFLFRLLGIDSLYAARKEQHGH